jgi:hypothetical protein
LQVAAAMATFELYRRSTIGMCLTETLDEMVSSDTLSPELAIQVLVQFDKVKRTSPSPWITASLFPFWCLLLWKPVTFDFLLVPLWMSLY